MFIVRAVRPRDRRLSLDPLLRESLGIQPAGLLFENAIPRGESEFAILAIPEIVATQLQRNANRSQVHSMGVRDRAAGPIQQREH